MIGSLAGLVGQALLACPQCALNTAPDTGFWWVLGAMVLLPFPTVGIVIYSLKRMLKAEAAETQETP